jgi:hypothetical protein
MANNSQIIMIFSRLNEALFSGKQLEVFINLSILVLKPAARNPPTIADAFTATTLDAL